MLVCHKDERIDLKQVYQITIDKFAKVPMITSQNLYDIIIIQENFDQISTKQADKYTRTSNKEKYKLLCRNNILVWSNTKI